MADLRNNQDPGYELDWESPIEKDMPDFEPLPEGEYDFEVKSFERGRFSPGPDSKISACPKAVLEICLYGEDREMTVRHQLLLHTKTEGRLCAFFASIGQRQKGERVTMNWGRVVGARGRCKVGIRRWAGQKDGKEMSANKILRFLEPEVAPAAKYEPGRF